MTDYELTDAFLSHTAVVITYFMAFVSATSALLIVAHFAGTTLPRLLARVVIGIYTVTTIFLVTSFQRQTTLLVEIRNQMGPTLQWHTAASEPSWILPAMIWLGTMSMVAIFASAIGYFAYVRTHADTNI